MTIYNINPDSISFDGYIIKDIEPFEIPYIIYGIEPDRVKSSGTDKVTIDKLTLKEQIQFINDSRDKWEVEEE